MCTQTTWSYPSADGIHTIFASLWTPDGGECRAIVQICHGMMEHIRRYDRFARQLCEQGFLVCGDDHLGHGRTAADRKDLGYFAEKDGPRFLTEDEHTLRREMQRRYPDKPYFLLGHSMGSFITRRYITQYGGGLAGYLCCGTSGRNPGAKPGAALAALFSRLGGARRPGRLINWMAFHRYNSRVEHPETPWDWLSRDKEGYPDTAGDDALYFTFTNAAFRDLFRLLDSVTGRAWSDRVPKDLPIALFSGEGDPVGGYGQGVRQVYDWLKQSGVRDVSLTSYPGARHELHNETNRDEFLADVLSWIEAHMDGGKGTSGEQ